jgi:aspartyl-tRNA(Asn)/glutamyl-tRNA(Gln) amidotransferase subunit A
MQSFGNPEDDASPAKPTRVARYRGFFDRRAEPSMLSAFEEALGLLARQGVEIVELDDPVDFEGVIKDHRLVMSSEAANVHSDWLDEFPDDYPPRIRELVLEGRSHSALEYLRAKQRQGSFMSAAADDLTSGKYETLVTPAAIGTATDRSTTGDPAFNSPWSFGGYPTVTFPMRLAPDGLPLGLQFVNLLWLQDHDLLRTAEWCENALRMSRQ